jgi:hypothetical protein
MYSRFRMLSAALVLGYYGIFAGNFNGQFTLYDIDTTWVTTTFVNKNHLMQPDNWRTPYEYLHGDYYVRLTVTEKPTDLKVRAMWCFWLSGWTTENCTQFGDMSRTSFTSTGVHYFKLQPFTQWWVNTGLGSKRIEQGPLDRVLHQWWSGTVNKVLRSSNDPHCGSNEKWGPEADAHIPIKYRMEFIVVAQGHKLTPPAHWTNLPAQWDVEGGVAVNSAHHGMGSGANAAFANVVRIPKSAGARTIVHIIADNPVSIAIYSISGTRIFQHRSSGRETVDLSSKGILAGIYMIRIADSMQSAARKIIIR